MGPFATWLMSPLAQWTAASTNHKVVVGAAGAGVGACLYKFTKYPSWMIALYSIGAAYGVSLLLHTSQRMAAAPPAQFPVQPPVMQQPPITQAAPVDQPLDFQQPQQEPVFVPQDEPAYDTEFEDETAGIFD